MEIYNTIIQYAYCLHSTYYDVFISDMILFIMYFYKIDNITF